MLPVMLNFETLDFLLIGEGEKLYAREKKLHDLGVRKLVVIQPPLGKIKFDNFDVVMVVGLEDSECKNLHSKAKIAGCIVNIEDKKEYCDFFFQSFVKRGDLLISVSTNGKTPGTAKIIRDKIEEIFPAEWGNHIDEISAKRIEWKNSGKNYDEVNELTKNFVKQKNWL